MTAVEFPDMFRFSRQVVITLTTSHRLRHLTRLRTAHSGGCWQRSVLCSLVVNDSNELRWRSVTQSWRSLTLSKAADRHSLVMRGMMVFFNDVYSTSPANVGIIPRHSSYNDKTTTCIETVRCYCTHIISQLELLGLETFCGKLNANGEIFPGEIFPNTEISQTNLTL